MLKILLCLQKKKKKFAISLFYISFTTLNYFPSIPGARFVASFQRRKWNLFTYSWMKNTSLAWIERGHDRAHGAVVHASLCHRFPFHPFSRASLSPSPSPLLPSHSCEIYRQWREVPNGIQSADIVVTVRQNMRENRDEPRKRRRWKRKRANSSLPRKRYRRPRNAQETKSVS